MAGRAVRSRQPPTFHLGLQCLLPSLPQILQIDSIQGFGDKIVDKKIQIFFGGSKSPATFGALLQRTPGKGVD